MTQFLERGLFGFYLPSFATARPTRETRSSSSPAPPRAFRVTEVARLYTSGRDDVEGMRRAADLEVLPESWRDYFRKRLEARAA